MKKTLLSIMLVVAPITMFAQLKVESNGKVIAGTKLMNNSNWSISLQSGITSASNSNNAAFYGKATANSGGVSYGVFGVAGSTSGGSGNFGVVGCVESTSTSGAGVLGCNYNITNTGLIGNYAGYFMGNAKVTGTMTVNSLVQTSDSRLKENIVSLSKRDESILSKVLDMNVIEYNYKPLIPSLVLPDSVSTEEVIKKAGLDTSKKHYGVIAQELQELFPALVDEDQDGYLGVNYVELVPVLIRAIQELKAQVDALQGNAEQTINRVASTTSISNLSTSGNVLYQNTPNPFNEQTTIRFKLSDNVQDASICIFDMTGKILKKQTISSGDSSIRVNGWELGEGMFLYSLIVNGQVIETKKMVILK